VIPPSTLPVWLEIQLHDTLQLEPVWAALDAAVRAAEDAGARLSLRVPEALAAAVGGAGKLRAMASRGHEIGALAHGEGLARAVAQLRRAGVRPRVATPGLRRLSRGHRDPVLRRVASARIGVVVDRGEERAWAYEGLRSRREEGIEVLAPTVLPRHWMPRSRVTADALATLAALELEAEAQGAHWFGVTLDASDLLEDDAPDAGAIAALGRWMDRRVGAVVGPVVDPRSAAPLQRTPTVTDRRLKVEAAAGDVLAAARRRWPDRLRRPTTAPAPAGEAMVLAAGGRRVQVERFGPPSPRAAIACSISGPVGARAEDLAFLGLSVADLTERGCSVWLYHRDPLADRSRRPELGQAPHADEQIADWRALLRRAREDGAPVVALTWSASVLVVLRAAAAGDRPDALVDAEAPSDRWALFHPRGKGPSGLDRWKDDDWEGLEAWPLMPELQRPYARLQAAHDHVHGPMTLHAERMVAAARASGVAVREPVIGPGRLHAHPHEALDALDWAVGHATSR